MWLEILQDIKETYIVAIQHLNYFIFFAYPFINKKNTSKNMQIQNQLFLDQFRLIGYLKVLNLCGQLRF